MEFNRLANSSPVQWTAFIILVFATVSATKVLLKQLLFFLSGRKLGYTFDNKNLHNVSLGQGQEVIAEQALNLAAKNGHWVILQVQQIYF